MASYVVTGASRGLGYEFLRQLSNDPANTVVGLVRDKAATEAKVNADLRRPNIHILHGDLDNYDSLKKAADETAKITDGRLDYLIANAAVISTLSRLETLGVLGKDPTSLEQDLLSSFQTNVIGNIHLFNLFLPLIMRGVQKKVIAITTGLADINVTAKFDLDVGGPYCISKAAQNVAVTKFSAEYAKDGVLFMSISPGVIDTGALANATQEELQRAGGMFAKFKAYAPHFAGPSTAEASIKDVLSVIEKSSVAKGNGGTFVSQYGNQQWL